MIRKQLGKKSIYEQTRYWYHLSSTLIKEEIFLKPWGNDQGFNRSEGEPDIERICVAPSVAQCLTAIPYCPGDTFTIYRTKRKMKATEPFDIFDSNVTKEGWILIPTFFIRMGEIFLGGIEEKEGIILPEQVASENSPQRSGKVLKWWKKLNIKKHITP